MSFLTILYNVVLSPITQIIEVSYRVFSQLFKNTGIAILGVSLTVTLLCLPLYIVAEDWEEKERNIQSKLKSGIERIKKAFSGDEQYMILSTYYRQNHYHPIMALRSSFGILIQIPFFLAAYHTLSGLPDLQGKSFLFIKNMGLPDSIFTIRGFSINILPIAMTAINCISGAIYSKGHGIREKIQIYGMALLFLVVLYNSPAGLVLYWTMNNIFSLVKNIFYKMKNPLKVLYFCFCAGVVSVILYIWIFYSKGAGLDKKIPATSALLFLIPIPFYVKGINALIDNHLKDIFQNRNLRHSLFFISAISLVILTGLTLPANLISSSVQEFSDIENYTNPNAFLHSSFWMSFGLFLFWPACIYFLFKERIQTTISVLFTCLLFCGIINAFIFTGDYGSMDETLKFIDTIGSVSTLFIFLNSLSLLAVFVLIIFAVKYNGSKILRNLTTICLFVFTIFSIVKISSIKNEYTAYKIQKESNNQMQDDSAIKYHLSKNQKNIIVFMFDRFESSYIKYILNDVPELKEKLNGFIYYPNTVSFNGHTLMGSPGVYGGYEYTPLEMNKRNDVKLRVKHNEALSLLPTILAKEGFYSTVSDLSWANYVWEADMTFAKDVPNTKAIKVLGRYSGDFKREALVSPDSLASLSHTLNRNLFWTSLFREAPAPLRPIIYYKGTWWENGIKETSSSFVEWFSALHYMNKITAVDSQTPTLNIITNEATHSSEDISMYDLGLPQKNSLPKENSYPANIAVLKEVARFCDFLKENEIYDNTRILITSDHGIGINAIAKEDYKTSDIGGYSKDHFHCVLLEKDFNSSESFSIDNTFMTNADVPSLALKGIIDKAVNPFTHKEISISSSNEYKKNGVNVTIENLFMPGHSKSEYEFTVSSDSWYNVKDNIFIDDNWKKCN